MDYGGIIWDKPNYELFKKKTERIQFKIAITGTIQEIWREILYQELGLESLSDRSRFRKLFKKVLQGLS